MKTILLFTLTVLVVEASIVDDFLEGKTVAAVVDKMSSGLVGKAKEKKEIETKADITEVVFEHLDYMRNMTIEERTAELERLQEESANASTALGAEIDSKKATERNESISRLTQEIEDLETKRETDRNATASEIEGYYTEYENVSSTGEEMPEGAAAAPKIAIKGEKRAPSHMGHTINATAEEGGEHNATAHSSRSGKHGGTRKTEHLPMGMDPEVPSTNEAGNGLVETTSEAAESPGRLDELMEAMASVVEENEVDEGEQSRLRELMGSIGKMKTAGSAGSLLIRGAPWGDDPETPEMSVDFGDHGNKTGHNIRMHLLYEGHHFFDRFRKPIQIHNFTETCDTGAADLKCRDFMSCCDVQARMIDCGGHRRRFALLRKCEHNENDEAMGVACILACSSTKLYSMSLAFMLLIAAAPKFLDFFG